LQNLFGAIEEDRPFLETDPYDAAQRQEREMAEQQQRELKDPEDPEDFWEIPFEDIEWRVPAFIEAFIEGIDRAEIPDFFEILPEDIRLRVPAVIEGDGRDGMIWPGDRAMEMDNRLRRVYPDIRVLRPWTPRKDIYD
jgi:hypothetical protein